MAFNQDYYNNPFLKAIDRGETPEPGQLPAEDPNQRIRYIAVPDGSGGWKYYLADGPSGRAVANDPGATVGTLPASAGIVDGQYQAPGEADPADWQGMGQPAVQNPQLQPGPATAPPSPAAPTPAVPAPSAAPVGQPAGASQPSLTPPPAGPSQTSVNDASRGGIAKPDGSPATGRWMRVTSWDNNSDILGVDLVRADSTRGTQILADKNAKEGQQYQYVDTDWKHSTTGVPLPEELTGSGKFQAIARMPGMTKDIVDFNGDAPAVDASGASVKGYKVTFRLANGAQQSVTFARSAADGKESFQISGVPEWKMDGVTSPNKEALTLAQIDLERARAEHSRVQKEGGDLDNARKTEENAEIALNRQLFGRAERTSEIERSGLTVAQTRGQEATTASVIQGTQNQTYQNVLQYYRDKTGDEAKALELTMQFFNNRANVDQNNNNTALRAGEAMVNAETSANTQRVSLANNRLSQSNQGYTDDLKTSSDLNQYINPGSDKGFKGFMAMQALRYANAQKYGAFDVNDKDLKYDKEKLPNSIRAFANPTAPSFATYPDLPSMRDEASNTADRLGGRERPSPPNHTDVVKPVQTSAPGAAPRTGNGQTAAPAPSSPGFTGYKPPAPEGQAATLAASQPKPADGAERDDDILTVQGQMGEPELMTRAEYNVRRGRGELQGTAVRNAESRSLYTQNPDNGQYTRMNPQADGAQRTPSEDPVGGRVLPQSEASNERPDDVITFFSIDDNGVRSEYRTSRTRWNGLVAQGQLTDGNLITAQGISGTGLAMNEQGDLYELDPLPPGESSKIMTEHQPSPGADSAPRTTTDTLGFDVGPKPYTTGVPYGMPPTYATAPVTPDQPKSLLFDESRYPQYGSSGGSFDPRAVQDLLGFQGQRQAPEVYDNFPRYTTAQVNPTVIEPYAQNTASQYTQQELVDGPARAADEERLRREREEWLRRSQPQAIYGLFENAYSF